MNDEVRDPDEGQMINGPVDDEVRDPDEGQMINADEWDGIMPEWPRYLLGNDSEEK
ncbi:MAG: hypothetical protein F6K34_24310 [Okeania sp. SIO4D6]|nr:hypothetical protein [Okeania sp. SIO4D6]